MRSSVRRRLACRRRQVGGAGDREGRAERRGERGDGACVVEAAQDERRLGLRARQDLEGHLA